MCVMRSKLSHATLAFNNLASRYTIKTVIVYVRCAFDLKNREKVSMILIKLAFHSLHILLIEGLA